jgi:hypothetical protein
VSVAGWTDFEREAPELAQVAWELLDARRHRTLATLRRDGAPRISGTELARHEGQLWIGSMWQARKALDLQRDPRYALHSGSEDPPAWKGDAKLSGRAEEITDPAEHARIMHAMTGGQDPPGGQAHLFRLDLDEVAVVRLGEPADHLVIEVWRPGQGVKTMRR